MPIPNYSKHDLEKIKKTVRRVDRMRSPSRGERRHRKANDQIIWHQSFEHDTHNTNTDGTTLQTWLTATGNTGTEWTHSAGEFTPERNCQLYVSAQLRAAATGFAATLYFTAAVEYYDGATWQKGAGDNNEIDAEMSITGTSTSTIQLKDTYNIEWSHEVSADDGEKLRVVVDDGGGTSMDVTAHLTLMYWLY